MRKKSSGTTRDTARTSARQGRTQAQQGSARSSRSAASVHGKAMRDSFSGGSQTFQPQAFEQPSSSRSARTQSSRSFGGNDLSSGIGGTPATSFSGGSSQRSARGQRAGAAGSRTQRAGRTYSEGAQLSSVSVGEIRRSERHDRAQAKARRYAIRVIVVLVLAVLLVLGGGVAYNSNLFAIANVDVQGVDHLTQSEMAQLAAVPEDTTLLRVDTETIKARLLQNAWVQDASVERRFPDTLVIKVTERTVAAVVNVPTSSGKSTKRWAISSDHMWLMPIPDKDSDAGKNTSEKIYEDADAALKITDVPYGTEAAIGTYCTDSNVLNALDIVSGMTTELAGMVVEVSASGADETTLMLSNGVEVAFGKAENIRDKERVVLQILEENEGSVSYINVRTVSNPTWRTV